MNLNQAIEIVRLSDPAGKDVDAENRIVSGQFYKRVPENLIGGWDEARKSKYFLRMKAALAEKQVWVIDANLAPDPTARGWNLRFFVDACERKNILPDMH